MSRTIRCMYWDLNYWLRWLSCSLEEDELLSCGWIVVRCIVVDDLCFWPKAINSYLVGASCRECLNFPSSCRNSYLKLINCLDVKIWDGCIHLSTVILCWDHVYCQRKLWWIKCSVTCSQNFIFLNRASVVLACKCPEIFENPTFGVCALTRIEQEVLDNLDIYICRLCYVV